MRPGSGSIPGTLLVSRVAWQHGSARALWTALGVLAGRRPLAVQVWQEHRAERSLVRALGLRLGAVKIAASSDMRGVYVRPEHAPPAYSRQQAVGLARLPLDVPPLGELIEQVAGIGALAQHYSSYNRRGSWTALALRGFYDDPERIEKPAEQ